MALRCWSGAAAGVVAAGTAAGQILPVGPFSGPHTEGFETQSAAPNQLYTCVPDRIFLGTADLCDHESNSVAVPTLFALFCPIVAHQGLRFAMGIDRPVEVTFDSPAVRFGGYFATVGGTDGGEVLFFNASGLIGTVVLTTNQCNWMWNGWEGTTPFTRVRIVGHSPFAEGGYIHLDDLEYQGTAGVCYPNCDGSTTVPVLNVNDFTCFLNRFAAGDPYANCDGSTIPPVLNVNDFICFQGQFAAGCR